MMLPKLNSYAFLDICAFNIMSSFTREVFIPWWRFTFWHPQFVWRHHGL